MTTTEPRISEAINEYAAMIGRPKHGHPAELGCNDDDVELLIAELLQGSIRQRTILVGTTVVTAWYCPYGWRDTTRHRWQSCQRSDTRATWRVETSATPLAPGYYCEGHLWRSPAAQPELFRAPLTAPDRTGLVRVVLD